MKNRIIDNWISTVETISKNPVVFGPFAIIAFFECLALEISYFSVLPPLSRVFDPIVRKFFGENFLHYPSNLILLPKLFYYGQMAIYILVSVFLSAVAIQMFVNARSGLPVIARAVFKNTAKRYASFVGYGLFYILLMFILEKGEGIVFLKGVRFLGRHGFKISAELYAMGAASLLFVTFVIVQSFIMMTIPIMIAEKKSLLKALLGSIAVSARNFLKIFCLILVPFLLYIPVILMKTFMTQMAIKTFPEISFCVTFFGIVMSVVVDCFVMLSVTQFLLNTKKAK